MKTVFISFLLLNVLPVFSQQQFSVDYRTEVLTFVGKDADSNRLYMWRNATYLPEYKLSVDHKTSFFRNPEAPVFKKGGHCNCPIYYTDSSRALYYPVQPITEKELMVRDTVESNWAFTMDTDTILGFPCRRATKPVGKEYVDAWYCWELPQGFGPFNYGGLPGTILRLETAFTRYSATTVSETPERIFIPETAIISEPDYRKVTREKRMYRAGLFGKRVDPYEVPRITSLRF